MKEMVVICIKFVSYFDLLKFYSLYVNNLYTLLQDYQIMFAENFIMAFLMTGRTFIRYGGLMSARDVQ